jgi:2',3'-cyclic-nucleotide 2'-phosphodiesterase (5'-nucleotidase family)
VSLALWTLVAGCQWRLASPPPGAAPGAAATATPARVATAAPTPTLDLTPREIVILHTNDEHGYLDYTEQGGSAIGGANLAAALWAARGHDPLAPDSNVLLLSGGDNWTGPAVSTWFAGESTVEVMNAMGYRASVPGNHEFDFGQEALRVRLSQAQFPFLAANVFDAATGILSDLFEPYTIVTVNGVQVGIIGLALRTTPNSTGAKGVAGLAFGDYEPALREWAPRVRAAGAQVLVVQTHACNDELVFLAEAVQDLDIALLQGGHCHSSMIERAGGTLVSSASSAWRDYVLTRLTVEPGSGKILASEQTLLDVRASLSGGLPKTPPAVAHLVAKWQERAELTLGEEIGYTATGLQQHAPQMHNLLVDAWLWAYPNAQMAISNTGGFRQGLDRGVITLKELVGILPFDNELIEIEASGNQILQALRNAPEALVLGGAALQGNRLVLVDGSVADGETAYRLLITDYLYDNPKYPFGRFDREPYETSIHWRQPAIDWIKAQRTSRERPLEQLLDATVRLP